MRGTPKAGRSIALLIASILVAASCGHAPEPKPNAANNPGGGGANPEPFVVPPGGLIAFNRANSVGFLDVYLANPDGSNDRRAPVDPESLPDAENPAFSRDGSLIAVTGYAQSGARTIFVMHPDGTGLADAANIPEKLPAPIPGQLNPLYKAFSPDGKLLAYTAFELPEKGSQSEGVPTKYLVVVVGIDGSNPVAVGGGDDSVSFGGFGIDWSPAGDLLAVPGPELGYNQGTYHDNTAIYVIPPEQGAQDRALYTRISDPQPPVGSNAHDVLPAFSPDGQRVAFVRGVFAGTSLISCSVMVVGSGGGAEQVVLQLPGEAVTALAWSPDGKSLLFDRGPEEAFSFAGITSQLPVLGGKGLWRIDVDGQNLVQVVAPPALNGTWAWGT